jgi:hypothetical protein
MIFKYIQKITGCRNLAIFVEHRRTYAKKHYSAWKVRMIRGSLD